MSSPSQREPVSQPQQANLDDLTLFNVPPPERADLSAAPNQKVRAVAKQEQRPAATPDLPPVTLPWDFTASLPAPRDDAIDAGNLHPEDAQPENLAALHETFFGEVLGLMRQLDVVRESRRTGRKPETGRRPTSEKGRAKLATDLAGREFNVSKRIEGLHGVYADSFGFEAGDAFRAAVEARYGNRPVMQDGSTPHNTVRLASANPPAAKDPREKQGDRYEIGHPWHYYAKGDDAEPPRVEAIRGEGKLTINLALPKDPQRRQAKLERLHAEYVATLEDDRERYAELIDCGIDALSRFDRASGDPDLAWATAVAIKVNNIRYDLDHLAAIEAAGGSTLWKPATDATLPEPKPDPDRPADADLSSPTVQLGLLDRDAFQAADRDERGELVRQTIDRGVQTLAADLEAGKSDNLVAMLAAMGRFHRYSFSNQILILMQQPDATRVAGFRKWNEFNRHVRKGEQGIVVMAPVTKVVAKREEEQKDGSRKEVPVLAVVNTKPVFVFDVSQTDGEPLPSLEKAAGDPGEHLAALERFAAKRGIEVVRKQGGSALGSSSGGTVTLREDLSPADAFVTLVHELAHELLHRDDEDRSKLKQGTSRKVRETEAEAVAFVVAIAVGLELGKASSDYIQLYRGTADTLAESLDAVSVAARDLLDALASN